MSKYNKEISAIIESLVFVEEQMEDKQLSKRLADIYINYLKKEYPSEDTFSMIKKYKKQLKRQLK